MFVLVILFSFGLVSAVVTPDVFGHQAFEIDWTATSCSDGQVMTGISNVGSAACGAGNFLSALDGDPFKAVYVDNEGDVGIGTTSPGAKLEVKDTGDTRILVSGGEANSKVELALYPTGTDNSFVTYDNNLLFYSDGVGTVAAISPTGNVGIGTTSPDAKLEVGNTDGFTNGIRLAGSSYFLEQYMEGPKAVFDIFNSNSGTFEFKDGDEVKMTIDGSGNVGIRTTHPDAPLDVKTTGFDSVGGIRLEDSTSVNKIGYFGQSSVGNDGDGVLGIITDNVGETIRFDGASGADSYFNVPNGNVGIGTSDPGASLHIKSSDGIRIEDDGTVNYWQFYTDGGNLKLKEDNGVVKMTVDNSGNVAIVGNLDVGGTIIAASGSGGDFKVLWGTDSFCGASKTIDCPASYNAIACNFARDQYGITPDDISCSVSSETQCVFYWEAGDSCDTGDRSYYCTCAPAASVEYLSGY